MDYGTRNYNIIVGKDAENNDRLYYTVVNRETQVVEYEDNIFPRTLDATKNLQQLYDDALTSFYSKEPTVLTIAGDSNGSQSAH